MSIQAQRVEYARLRKIAEYTMGKEAAKMAVAAQNPVTPDEWITAIKDVRCNCARCKGSGTYYWGACINGKMTHSAPCARCDGKGWMNFDDMRRGKAYDAHAIVRACRV